MEWMNRLNQAVEYIEQNLEGEIQLERAAEIACCSTYHFQRMFSYIAGMTLSEYIRRRRMSLAAFQLQSSDVKVIDLALKYGYDSPTAFTRAFQKIHAITPSAARERGQILKSYQKIVFSMTVKGDTEMQYRIEERKEIRVVGAKIGINLNIEENFEKIPRFWGEGYQNGMVDKIGTLINQEPMGLLGISNCVEGQEMAYYIAAPTDQAPIEGTEVFVVPAATWAIFSCHMTKSTPNVMQEYMKRIFSEWLPSSGYEYANLPDVELYPAGDPESADYRIEIWVPVIKKR